MHTNILITGKQNSSMSVKVLVICINLFINQVVFNAQYAHNFPATVTSTLGHHNFCTV